MAHSTCSSRKPRAHAASQIAKDHGKFQLWSSFNNLVGGEYSEVPGHIQDDVDHVFEVFGQLPRAWVMPDTKIFRKRLQRTCNPGFLEFLQEADRSAPQLFSKTVHHEDCLDNLGDLSVVHAAWRELQRMRNSSVSWSEADYAAQVYNVLRVSARPDSNYRAHCSLSLPQPLEGYKACSSAAIAILNAKTVRPDGSLFIPASELSDLWQSASSPYNVLGYHPRANNAASHGGRSSFKWQATLCSKLPELPCFEIASCFWEDKKPEHKEFDAAYRQNRMATTAALRQLYALNVQAPVFGLVWCDGKVRAHVDWWKSDKKVWLLSTAYPGPETSRTRRKSLPFHEWDLSDPGDIIQVYLLLRNLDKWTVNRFCERVKDGVSALSRGVQAEARSFVPWRRQGDFSSKDADVNGESISSSPTKCGQAKKKTKSRTTRRVGA